MSEQTDLSLILDGIENRHVASGGTMTTATARSLDDVPALVKALRRSMEFLEWALKSDPDLYKHSEKAVAAILQPSSAPTQRKSSQIQLDNT